MTVTRRSKVSMNLQYTYCTVVHSTQLTCDGYKSTHSNFQRYLTQQDLLNTVLYQQLSIMGPKIVTDVNSGKLI